MHNLDQQLKEGYFSFYYSNHFGDFYIELYLVKGGFQNGFSYQWDFKNFGRKLALLLKNYLPCQDIELLYILLKDQIINYNLFVKIHRGFPANKEELETELVSYVKLLLGIEDEGLAENELSIQDHVDQLYLTGDVCFIYKLPCGDLVEYSINMEQELENPFTAIIDRSQFPDHLIEIGEKSANGEMVNIIPHLIAVAENSPDFCIMRSFQVKARRLS